MKRLVAAAVALIMAGSLAACSGQDSAAELSQDAVIIDVRTASEVAETGILDGAEHLDLNNGDFKAALPTLDPEAEYALYCRSGNRAGQAKSMMEGAGFTDVINLGSLEDAAKATGREIVAQ